MSMYLKEDEITEQGLWAIEPLLDPSNVGKYVWSDWNGNAKSVSQIQKIGRTNIHCGYSPERTSSYRVEGGRAQGNQSGFMIHACSDQYRKDEEECRELVKVFVKQSDRVISSRDVKLLRDVVWCVGGLLGDD